MGKEKKKFGETKVGRFLSNVKDKLPDLAGDVADIVTSPNPVGALTNKLLPKLKAHKNPISNGLALELEVKQMEFEKELYALEVQDRDSARGREVEIAKTGKTDWLMYATGITGLGSFILMVVAVIWIPGVTDNKLFIHLMGMIEGVVISNLFSYYFGTSKTKEEKDRALYMMVPPLMFFSMYYQILTT